MMRCPTIRSVARRTDHSLALPAAASDRCHLETQVVPSDPSFHDQTGSSLTVSFTTGPRIPLPSWRIPPFGLTSVSDGTLPSFGSNTSTLPYDQCPRAQRSICAFSTWPSGLHVISCCARSPINRRLTFVAFITRCVRTYWPASALALEAGPLRPLGEVPRGK